MSKDPVKCQTMSKTPKITEGRDQVPIDTTQTTRIRINKLISMQDLSVFSSLLKERAPKEGNIVGALIDDPRNRFYMLPR
jgi:hypothetical protein